MREAATEEQIDVINAPLDRHIKVVAVAGSGKSWTMRRRVARLQELGTPSQSILVMMFNKSAQMEFDYKLKKLMPNSRPPQARTYHSLGYRLCMSLAKKAFIPNYELNTSNTTQLFLGKNALKNVVGDQYQNACNPTKPGVVESFLSFVDLVKSNILTPEEIFNSYSFDDDLSLFIKAFDVYETARQDQKLRFFNDLLYDPVRKLISCDSSQGYVTNRLQHVIVDEYQDINPISQQLIKILAGDTAQVTAVGDDDQCLYGFRGSRPDYLVREFDNDFCDPLVYTLSNTFRYGHAISLASNNVINNNRDRVSKLCVSSDSTPASIIELREETASKTNQAPVIESILNWTKQGGNLKDIAILVRVFSIAPPIELALLKKGIAYRLEGSPSVLDMPEIQGLINLLKIGAGTFFNQTPEDIAEGLHRILMLPHPGIGHKKLEAMINHISKSPKDWFSLISETAAAQPPFIGNKLKDKAEAISTILTGDFSNPVEIFSVYFELTKCFENIREMSLNSEDADLVISAIEAFVDFCGSKASPIVDLINEIHSLKQDQDNNTNNVDSLLITSVHRSKGLEWPLVILPRLAESTFPYIREDDYVDIESERRLFYVAMTRAIQKLVLVTPKDKGLVSSLNSTQTSLPAKYYGESSFASRFIYEANLTPCMELSKVLDAGSSYCDIATGEHRHLFNKYLTKIGAQFRLSGIG